MEYSYALIIPTLISSILTLIILIYVIVLRNKHNTRNYERQNSVKLSVQRERFEQELYKVVQTQPMENLALTGSEELFMPLINNSILSKEPVNMSYFESMGISIQDMNVLPKYACVIMPFHNRFSKVHNAIGKACIKAGISLHRSDESFSPGSILRTIVEMILKSQIVIAVLDGHNPNVFYEIGIAHAIGKPVVFIANKSSFDSNKSFDVNHNRIILYNNPNELENSLYLYLKNLSEK